MTNVKSALVINTLMALGTAAMIYVGTLHVLDGRLTLGQPDRLHQLPCDALRADRSADANRLGAGRRGRRGATLLRGARPRRRRPRRAGRGARSRRRAARIRFEDVDFGYDRDAADPARGQSGHPARRARGVRRRHRRGQEHAALASCRASTIPPPAACCSTGATCARSRKNRCARRSASSLQDTLLFSTTVRENIAYGRPDATDAEIIEAARARAGGRVHPPDAATATTARWANAAAI